MILVSGCLVGQKCRYDGTSETIGRLREMVEVGEAIPVCPEQLGGLPTPRPPQEIRGGDGAAVLAGRARVIDSEGRDVTQSFMKGAGDALVIAEDNNIKEAVLKSESPACGSGKIYDGTFSNRLRDGDGVTAALLKRHGIEVITEEEFEKKSEKEEKEEVKEEKGMSGDDNHG